MLRYCLLVLCLATSPIAAAVEAGELLGFDLLAPEESQPGRNLGRAIAVSGNLAVAGAPGEQVSGKFLHGAAYVFERVDGRWRQRARLDLAGGSASSAFGQAVAISGSQVLVGAPGLGAGTVVVFEGSGSSWSEVQRLAAAGSDDFGYALAIDGDRVLVGAPREGGGGAAYVFERVAGAWGQAARLVASNRADGDQFGRELGLDGPTAVVGAPFRGANSQGAAYVFELDGSWSEVAPLEPSPTASAYAGWSVAVEGSQLMVGAPGHATGTGTEGAVFRYVRGAEGWVLQQVLGQDLVPGDGFGQSLAFEGGVLVVGARGIDRAWGRRGMLLASTLGPQGLSMPEPLVDAPVVAALGEELALSSGLLLAGAPFDSVGGNSAHGRVAAFHFDGNAWIHDGMLESPLVDATRRFGRQVAISGLRAAVGVPWQEVGGAAQRGAVQLFDFDGQRWVHAATVMDPVGNAGDRFGSSVALQGDRLLVGAPRRDNTGTDAGGSALLFEHDGAGWQLAWRHDNAFEDGDAMGSAVALDGDRAAIAAPGYAAGVLADAGRVVVLERIGGVWSEVANLFGAAAGEELGEALAFDAGTLVAGAPDADGGSGRARVYRDLLGSWSQLTSVAAPTGAQGFGRALALSGGVLAVAAPDAGDGQVRAYRVGTTSLAPETLPAAEGTFRFLGDSLAVDEGLLLVGSLEAAGAPAAFHVYERVAQDDWRYRGRRDAPDGAALFPDGFGSALAIDRPLLLAGAEWRARDEGRVFAFVETAAASLSLNGTAPAAPVVGQPFEAQFAVDAAQGAPGGEVEVTYPGQDSCSGSISAGAGACTLHAGDAGNALLRARFLPELLPWLPAEAAPLALTVAPAQTGITVSSPPVAPHPGQVLELTATLSVVAPGSGSPTGTIGFHEGDASGPTLCATTTGNPTCATTAPGAGTIDIVARYAGDGDFQASVSGALQLTVQPWPTTVDRGTPSPATPRVDETFSVPVTVTAAPEAGVPVGRVRLLVGTTPGPWVPLDAAGTAVAEASAPAHGSLGIRAEFDGEDGDFADSLGASGTLQVAPLASATELAAVPDSGVVAGDTVQLAAAVVLEDASLATGSISLHLGSTDSQPICVFDAPSGGCSFVPPSSGQFTLLATYLGDARASGSSDSLVLSVGRATTTTTLLGTQPSTPRVDEAFEVLVSVASDVSGIGGSVRVADGAQHCMAALVAGTGSCTLTAGVRGPRTLTADFMASNDIHADSSAPPLDIEVEGIPTSITVDVSPAGPYEVGDSVIVAATTSGAGGDDPAEGLLTLRLDDADGAVICARSVDNAICPLELPRTGHQVIWASFEGSARHAPSYSDGLSFPVEPLPSTIAWLGSTPDPVLVDEPVVLAAAVSSTRGVPVGRVDFTDDSGLLCAGVLPDPGDGIYRCNFDGFDAPGTRHLDLAFHSDSPDYRDAVLQGNLLHVRTAEHQVRVALDDGRLLVAPGEQVDYLLTVRNLAVADGVQVELVATPGEGIDLLRWTCVDATNGAACPVEGTVQGGLHVALDLPPASRVEFVLETEVADPAPLQLVLDARASLPADEVNDDSQALHASDTNRRLGGSLFGNGFEPAVAD